MDNSISGCDDLSPRYFGVIDSNFLGNMSRSFAVQFEIYKGCIVVMSESRHYICKDSVRSPHY